MRFKANVCIALLAVTGLCACHKNDDKEDENATILNVQKGVAPEVATAETEFTYVLPDTLVDFQTADSLLSDTVRTEMPEQETIIEEPVVTPE